GCSSCGNQVVFKSGGWFVVRSTRTGSKSVACTGFYKDHRGIQLSKDSLILKFDGELQQVTIALNGKAGTARAPQDIEQQVHAVVLTGPDFERLNSLKKITVEVETDKGRHTQNMTLAGMKDALENMALGCPVPDESVVPARRVGDE